MRSIGRGSPLPIGLEMSHQALLQRLLLAPASGKAERGRRRQEASKRLFPEWLQGCHQALSRAREGFAESNNFLVPQGRVNFGSQGSVSLAKGAAIVLP